MSIRSAVPTSDAEPPSWAEYWAEVRNEWLLAAREVLQMNDRAQTVASEYARLAQRAQRSGGVVG